MKEPRDYSYKFTAIPSPGELVVPVPPLVFRPAWEVVMIKGRELMGGAFCVDVDSLTDGDLMHVVLPPGFYGREFLQLDAGNVNQLHEFQEQYGRIVGARKNVPVAHDMMTRLRPEPDNEAFSGDLGRIFEDQLRGINKSGAFCDVHEIEGSVDSANYMTAASLQEVAHTVMDAQWIILATTKLLMPGPVSREEKIDAIIACTFMSNIISKACSPISLVLHDIDYETPRYDLMTAVYIQLSRALLHNEEYRYCKNPECNRLFTPKEFTRMNFNSKEVTRRSDSQYCQSSCQERAKYLRNYTPNRKNHAIT